MLYDICGVNGDFIQTTASAQPLALVHSGTNYVWFSGVAGNYFSTPSASANQLLGNFTIETSHNLTLSRNNDILSKASTSSSQFGFRFGINSSNNLFLCLSTNGTSFTTYTSTTTTTANYIGVRRTSSSGDIVFITSIDGVTWTQLGTTVSGLTGNIHNSTSVLELGSCYVGTTNNSLGTINFIKLYSDNSGTTLSQIFNPSSYNRATSQTSWVSATGETWTLNTASTNNALKSAIVDQTMIMGNGTSYGMCAPNLNINDTAITSYTVFRKFVNTLGGQIISELGANINTGQGKLHTINEGANDERISIRANTGINASSFTSTSLSLKVAIGINNISNANESLPYLINNVSQSFLLQPLSSNNTTAMNATGYNLLARNNSASAWANVIATGDIVAKGENDNAQRTAMYNLLKTLSKI